MTGEDVEQVSAEKPVKQAETVTITKAEWERSQRETAELRESERFWSQKARGGKEEQAEPEEEEIDTDGLVIEPDTGNDELDEAIRNDPEKWTDALTKGPKVVEKLVRKMGFVSAKEAAEIAVKAARQEVGRTVKNMQADNQLVGDFKDMQDPKSELFQTAAPIYQRLVKMNGGKQTTALLYAAAEAAKAKLDAKPAPKHKDDDYERYDPEEDRRARADAQGASRGRRAAAVEEDDGELGPQAMEICRQMGVKPEDFRQQQKELGTRRRK